MKRIFSRLILFAAMPIALLSLAACSLDSNNDTPEITIDPPMDLRFTFGEDGVPKPKGFPWLEETAENLRGQLVGHGWDWVRTHEILENGCVVATDFYRDMIGISPNCYYFKSDTEAVQYFARDAVPSYSFWNRSVSVDYDSGEVLFDPSTVKAKGMAGMLGAFCFYFSDGLWHLVCVEHLGIRHGANDVARSVWGMSEYKQMTPERLAEVQKLFCNEFKPSEPQKPEEVTAKNVSTSPCKENMDAKTRASIDDGVYIQYTAERKEDGLYLHFVHVNMAYVCGTPGAECTAKLEDGVITIDEREKPHEPGWPEADCFCPYDVTFDVGPLEPGHYDVVFTLYGRTEPPYATFSIDLDESLSGSHRVGDYWW